MLTGKNNLFLKLVILFTITCYNNIDNPVIAHISNNLLIMV